MSNQLFKRLAAFTDIHLGLKHNSRLHNEDCVRFINWFISEAKERNCETCIFLGDFHHHRASINVTTLNYSLHVLNLLDAAFETVYFITGNHDLYYKEKRELHSLPMAEKFPNIVLIDELFVKDDVAIVPWLVGSEWKEMSKLKTKYIFGHFELPRFKMNALVEMPDHGGLKEEDFKHQDYVFSGHFHKRQQRKKVHYIGNPFGHNYADVWDRDRGAMFLEWGCKPEYAEWTDGPHYISLDLSRLLDNPEKYLTQYTYAKVTLDVDISYEEANFLRETFTDTYNVREIKLIPQRDIDDTVTTGEIKFETVDQIVTDQLNAIESNTYNKSTLIQIYDSL